MLMGNLQGLISGVEQIVFDSGELSSPASSISTGNILNGDEDGWYTIITRAIGLSSAGTDGDIYVQFNGDTGTNYGLRGIAATNTTVADSNVTSSAVALRLCSVGNSGTTGFNVARIYAKSGAVRLMNSIGANYINGTTIDNIKTTGHVWSNTADNLVSMTFKGSYGGASPINVGTRIIILKSNNFTGGTPTGTITTPYIKGAWVRVGSQILSSAASSVTFSGLDGDRDVLYYISSSIKAASATGDIKINLNNDTGNNYGYQRLTATNTTVAAARATPSCLYGGVTGTNAYFSQHNTLLFAKQGFVRPAITQTINDITGTTVTALWTLGQSYSVTNTNITEIDIATTTNNFDAGSQFDLYALRPNG